MKHHGRAVIERLQIEALSQQPVEQRKIYSLLTQRLAEEVYAQVPGVREAYIWLGSQIGQPLDQPVIAAAQLILEPGVGLPDVRPAVMAFIARLARGELPVW